MHHTLGRSSLKGSPPATKKSPSHKSSPFVRTNSLRSHPQVPSPDQSPLFTSRSPPLRLPALHTENLRLEAFKLPKTDPPSPVRHYALKKRFGELAHRLDRIPSEDWLAALLSCHPEFSRELASNLERCREKLARSKLVREAIREEDGDRSDQSRGSKREEQGCF